MDLLFCCHRTTDTEDGTPPPPNDIEFAPRGNWGPSPHNSDEGSSGSDDEQSSDGDQPESSATAAGRTTSSRTTRGGNTARNTRRTHRINSADDGEWDPESNVAADLGLDLTSSAIPAPAAPDSGSTPSPGKQASIPSVNLGTRVLRSSRQSGSETDLKKASGTPANNGGKRNLAAVQEVDEPYGSDESPEPQRKVARQVGAISTSIGVEPEALNGEHDSGWYLASAHELPEVRRSAQHLLMMAS